MRIKSLIDHEYEKLSMTEELQDTIAGLVPVTFRLRQDYLTILQGIADLFKFSRASMGSRMLETALDEAFMALAPEDRRALADKADMEYQNRKGHWNNQVLAIEAKEAGLSFDEESA